MSAALESSGDIFYTIASNILYFVTQDLVQLNTLNMKLSMHCAGFNLEVWLCRKLGSAAHCTSQHLLLQLWDFTRPITLWMNCCHSQLLLLCHITTNSCLWNMQRKGNLMDGLTAGVDFYQSTMLEFTELLTQSFRNVCSSMVYTGSFGSELHNLNVWKQYFENRATNWWTFTACDTKNLTWIFVNAGNCGLNAVDIDLALFDIIITFNCFHINLTWILL